VGYTETLLGRQRKIPDITHKNKNLRSQAERLAVNSPIQGLAADIIKLAMLEVQNMRKKEKLKGYLVLQIHDELLFEVPEEEISIWQNQVKNIMERVFALKVPLIVDLAIGKNWKECYN
jgi:DNA polymerase-1